jgi:hypothetical protein
VTLGHACGRQKSTDSVEKPAFRAEAFRRKAPMNCSEFGDALIATM